MEIDDDEEEEATEKAQKFATTKALNDIESEVQLKNRPYQLKKRDLDGNIVDSTDPARKPKKTHLMKGKSGDSAHGQLEANITKGKLTSNSITLDRLLEEAQIHDADEDVVGLLFKINFEILVGIYCNRESPYNVRYFKDELKDMRVQDALNAHQLFSVLEKWRIIVSSVLGATPSIKHSPRTP